MRLEAMASFRLRRSAVGRTEEPCSHAHDRKRLWEWPIEGTQCRWDAQSRAGPYGPAPVQSVDRDQTGLTFAACLPLGPSTMSNSTSWPSDRVR